MAKADSKSGRTDNSNGDKSYAILHPVDLNRLVLPMQDSTAHTILPLCPAEYNEKLQERVALFAAVQAKIKKAGLSPEKEKQLHVAIQGYFREWFVTTNQFKSITDMVKMID